MNEICIENFEYISHSIKNISDYHIIISNNKSNYRIYGYEIGNSSEEWYNENNLMYIDFKNIKKDIIKKYNLDTNTNIYALILDSQSKYSNSSTNDLSFKLFLENGTELDISDMNDLNINVSMPMTNLDLLNYEYAVYFSKQGYDIYNRKSDFYNNICTAAYIEKNDITITDRKLEIFPSNVTLNKSNCQYETVDLNLKRLYYNCNFNTEIYNNEINDINEDIQDNNFIKYFLDLINFKLLICYKLLFDLESYNSNIGFTICIIDFILSIIFIISFFIIDFRKIRVQMFKEIPTKFNLYQIAYKQNNIIKTNVENNIIIKRNQNQSKIIKVENKIKNNIKDIIKGNKKENKNNRIYNRNKKYNEKKDNKKEKKNDNNKSNKSKKLEKKEVKDNKNHINEFKKYIRKKEKKKNKISNPIKKCGNKPKKSQCIKIKYENDHTKRKSKNSSSYNKILIYNTNIINFKNTNINCFSKKNSRNNNKRNILNLLNQKRNNMHKRSTLKYNSKFKIFKKYKSKKLENDEYDEMPYTKALRLDKRDTLKLFWWKILEKIEILDIVLNKKIKNILFSKYICYLLIDFFFNAFLYTDEVVSHKRHNNGELDFFVALTITLLSNIISSFIEYYLSRLINFEDKMKYIYEIKIEYIFLRTLKKYFKEITIRTTLFILEELIVILFCFYYIFIFCAIYNNTQLSLIKTYFISVIEGFITNIVITIIIISTRKLGISYKIKYLYNTSRYLDQHL